MVDPVAADMSFVGIPEDWLDQIIAELRKRHDDQQDYYGKNIDQTRAEYDRLKSRMRRLYEDYLDGRITQQTHDEYANELESKQQELNDRLKILTKDNKTFQVTASYLLDLAQRAEQLFKTSDEALRQKLLEYVLSNIELKDKKLSYMFNDPFKTIVETKKMALAGQKDNIWCG